MMVQSTVVLHHLLVFDGYWGYVKNGIWQVTEELGNINKSIGVEINISSVRMKRTFPLLFM